MTRIRTIDGAYKYILENDQESAITKTAFRRLIVSGKIPSFKQGVKYLVNLDAVDDYLGGMFNPGEKAEEDETDFYHNTIRRVC